jgi:hypothetical protein
MAPIGMNHDAIERFRLTGSPARLSINPSFVMATRTPARAAVLPSVAVRLSLLVLLLGILPGGFAV